MTPGTTAGRDPALRYAIVIPTVGRPSLVALLESLANADPAGQDDPWAPDEVIVVDDRGDVEGLGRERLDPERLPSVGGRSVRALTAGGRGPAAARNLGWRAATATWVVFLDDDVLVQPGWTAALMDDLAACAPDVAGSQGNIDVPLPVDRRPTDFERGTAGLESGAWITADMAYRTQALLEVSGFDERFPRAYREDADLALRIRRSGWRLMRGQRHTTHPVRPADDWYSVRVQAGNADDPLMRRLHGRQWRRLASVPRGRLPRHAATTASLLAVAVAAPTGRRRGATLCALAWAGLTTEFVAKRLLPGPRPGERGWVAEWRRMLLTSLVLPEAAVWHRLKGEWRWRGGALAWPPPLRAVLLDRDGTLIEDLPYNGDPERVRPMPGAVEAVHRLRAAALSVGVVTNQSGIGRGLLTRAQVDAVNRRVDDIFGGFDTWQLCPHAPEDRCGCRKPSATLVSRAADALGVRPEECAVIGDIGADVGAALAAGARPVLVPTEVTRAEEVAAAPVVATSLQDAVEVLLGANRGIAGGPRDPRESEAPERSREEVMST
ncbi:MAG TPA: HAD-IIIA family hydrolase [Actinomycetales bacterium]|nr:HAD-IIIA family hydrolase [Actinomycetales bacterium]